MKNKIESEYPFRTNWELIIGLAIAIIGGCVFIAKMINQHVQKQRRILYLNQTKTKRNLK